jgi:hypothetical protein
LKDAGVVSIEMSGVPRNGSVSVLSFDFELGDQSWHSDGSSGYDGYSNAMFVDGRFAGLDHLGVNDDDALLRILSKGMLAIEWPSVVGGKVSYRQIEPMGTAIPEPTSAWLYGAGLLIAGASRRRRV